MSGGMSLYAPGGFAGGVRAAGSGTGLGGAAAARPRPRVPVPPSYGQGSTMARGWPLRDFLELGALAGAVPCARLHAKAVLWEWGLSVVDQAELVVSELVTNAIQTSFSLLQPAVVRLWLLSDRRQVLILVWDGSPRVPVRPDTDPLDIAEDGRGLMLVEASSDQWSWYVTPEYGGKVIWALFTESGVAK